MSRCRPHGRCQQVLPLGSDGWKGRGQGVGPIRTACALGLRSKQFQRGPQGWLVSSDLQMLPLLTQEAPLYALLVNRLLVLNREGCLSEMS